LSEVAVFSLPNRLRREKNQLVAETGVLGGRTRTGLDTDTNGGGGDGGRAA
jgi:hypothetical protein